VSEDFERCSSLRRAAVSPCRSGCIFVWQLAFTPDEKWLFTTNGVSNDVSVIDVENLKVVKSIAVGRFPWGVVISDD